ncbi:unnamed protein product, partial [Mesorhabditis spiculigera]
MAIRGVLPLLFALAVDGPVLHEVVMNNAAHDERKWKILALTFNVAMQSGSPEAATQVLSRFADQQLDMIAVGFQEVQHLETFGAKMSTWANDFMDWFAANMPNMVVVARTYQATNQVFVLVDNTHLSEIRSVDYRYARNTMRGILGHKGSIGVRILLKGHGEAVAGGFVFVVSHFVHDVLQNERRILQYRNDETCSFPEDPFIWNRIWLGDLNFRNEIDPDGFEPFYKGKRLRELLDQHDQLNAARRRRLVFGDWSEAPINFPPSYRYYVGNHSYDLKRTPSWTDRVLSKGKLTVDEYDMIHEVQTSDHRPVFCKLKASVPPRAPVNWAVQFEKMPAWNDSVPVPVRFQYLKGWWSRFGSYWDWVGLYDASLTNVLLPIQWKYAVNCIVDPASKPLHSVCEFPVLPAGRYRFGYFSKKFQCLVGLSKGFIVAASRPSSR